MVLDYFLQFLLTTLSYVTPKDKTLLVFGCGNRNEFQGHPKYLYLYLQLQTQSDWEHVWSTENRVLYDELNNKGYPVIYKYSIKGFFTLLKAALFIHEKSSKDVYYIDQIVGRFRFFQTFHGVPLKMIGLDKIKFDKRGIFYQITKYPWLYSLVKRLKLLSMFKYKAMLAPSDEVKRIMQRAFDHDNVLSLGYPRNDVFFDKKLLYNDLRPILSLDKYDKVILYAPTFRDHKSSVEPFTIDFLLQLNAYCKEHNYLFLLKKHPWEKELKFPETLSNLKDVSSQVSDVQELLVWTDVLITDYSSVFFDFMVTGRPVIFYAYDLEEYQIHCRDMYYDYKSEIQGPIAKSENQLLDLIETIDTWSTEPEYIEKYAQVNQKFNTNNDGNSCERVLNILQNLTK
jgi:CDP-glycerol glycerophosphotransferase (TagB/SpsB family)